MTRRRFLKPWLCLLVLSSVLPQAAAQETGQLAEEENAPLVTDASLTLAAAFEAALARAPGGELLAAQLEAAESTERRRRSVVAAAPSLQLRYLSDRLQTRQGVSESEFGIDLPLWRWGQRDSLVSLARASRTGAAEDLRLHRWQVAGAVRESYWAVREAQQELQLARRDVEAFRELEQEVQRRIDAGDAAPGERLTAEGQRVAREATQHEAEVRLADRFFGWRVLTGLHVLPALTDETVAPEVTGYLPLDVARADAARAEAALAAAQAEGAGAPRLLLAVRHDAQDGSEPIDSLAAQLSMPLGGAGHRQAALAPLRLEAARARDLVIAMTREAQLAHHEAEHELHAREVALSDAGARLALAVDELGLARRAYRLGETDLAERLLTEWRAAEANRTHLLAVIAHSRAIARFNQINGVLP